MMLPCEGFLRGTHSTTRASPLAASSRARATSLGPASVSLATARIVRTVYSSFSRTAVAAPAEDVSAPAGTCGSASWNTACTAPGTPYS